MGLSIVQKIVIYIIPLIFAITLHEVAHAFVAYRCGDDTAKILGRLSINPLHHIDIIGTVIFPLIGIVLGGFIFGWAKPVPINFLRLHNFRRDLFYVALAGPLANFGMALIWALIFKLSFNFGSYFGAPVNLMAQAGIAINISLMLLNLLPILPLDGGRILSAILPRQYLYRFLKMEPYGLMILVAFLLLGGVTYILMPLYNSIINFIMMLIQ